MKRIDFKGKIERFLKFLSEHDISHQQAILLSLLLLGLCLRLYQIGSDSLWVDEANIVLISRGDFSTLLAGIKSHAAAMPLDYIITWMLSKISTNEGWLRLPSALWSTASLYVVFLLSKKYIRSSAFQWMAVFLLIISPFHISYAQELRFYASAGFFYLLATWVQIRAIEQNKTNQWALAVLITILGSYFHIYVILSIFNSLLWLLFNHRPLHLKTPLLWQYLTAMAISVTSILPGFFYFCVGEHHSYSPQIQDIFSALLVGMEWIPIYSTRLDLSWYNNIICFIFAISGIILAIRNKTPSLLALIISSILQIALITTADLWSSYFISARQLIILLPFNYLLIAWMAEKLWESVAAVTLKQISFIGIFPRVILVSLLIILLVSASFSLKDYYNYQKSLGREISQVLIREWQPGASIWLAPEWDWPTFWYYLSLKNPQSDLFDKIEKKT